MQLGRRRWRLLCGGANAAAFHRCGLADCVVVFRASGAGSIWPFGQTTGIDTVSGERAYLMPYGVLAPPQRFAMRYKRYMHEHGVRQESFARDCAPS